MALRGLPYYGGKSPLLSTSKWIVSLLGYDNNKSYIEPFAGMLGVLLSRKPVIIEIVNDLDSNLMNWWECVRDHPEEMAYKIYHTPRSRELFTKAIKELPTETDKIKKAVLYHTILSQSISQSTINMTEGRWGITYNGTVGNMGKWDGSLFQPLAQRLFNTQIENKNAVTILERTVKEEHTLIYCDPPYMDSDVAPYGKNLIPDKNEFIELLQSQKGDVAISGYHNEWDALGWIRHEKTKKYQGIGYVLSGSDNKRVEVLWTNFEPKPINNTTYHKLFS